MIVLVEIVYVFIYHFVFAIMDILEIIKKVFNNVLCINKKSEIIKNTEPISHTNIPVRIPSKSLSPSLVGLHNPFFYSYDESDYAEYA
ncbi:hypothetical protein TONV_073 [Tipula oleracea nudivirus]|uniref:Uncharacterized protein n=1 Tax=Tipula oleracea nudivirus TaxID=1546257 RepID=A0A0B4VGN8_9VIRU|nr:hypothetical protein TONV_073 [Tipula oleracea nudivirus]AJD20133.1 hypothetical protein TONV_073 [Tipula oleracea nudivirus]